LLQRNHYRRWQAAEVRSWLDHEGRKVGVAVEKKARPLFIASLALALALTIGVGLCLNPGVPARIDMLAIADVDDCARVDFVRNLPVDRGQPYIRRSTPRPYFGPRRNTSGDQCVLFAEALGVNVIVLVLVLGLLLEGLRRGSAGTSPPFVLQNSM
jgi:hypothetical protein